MRLRRNGNAIHFLALASDGSESKCVECGTPFDTKDHRRMGDSCGHEKCLSCLLKLVVRCNQCIEETCGAPAPAKKLRGYRCYKCDALFPLQANLANHMTTTHRNEKTPRPRTSIEKRTWSSLEKKKDSKPFEFKKKESKSLEFKKKEPKFFEIKKKDSKSIEFKKKGSKLMVVKKKPSIYKTPKWAKAVRPVRTKDHMYGVKKGKANARQDLLWTCETCRSSFYLFQQLKLHEKLHLVNFKLPDCTID